MLLVFGKKTCRACIEKKEELDKQSVSYIFYDLDTIDGLTEAALHSVVNDCEKSLPVIIREI